MRVLFYYRGGEHIGLESLISYLKSKGHEVELIFDPGLGDNGFLDIPILNKFCNDQLVIEKAIRFRPDLIAFCSITNLYSAITKIAKKFKEVFDVPIIIGGIHPTSLPEEVIKEDCYDMLCVGEGEEALEELLQRLKEKSSYADIKNLWVKDGSGKIHRNPKRLLIKSLDTLPPPDKTLFHKYGVLTSRLMVMTARGCPFTCTYCVNSFRNELYSSEKYLRQRSVPNVMEELIHLKNTYNPKGFRFEDDVFAYNVKWLREFKEVYRQHINLPFHCYVTPSTAKDSVLKELKEAGCSSVSMGIQSGSVEIRKKLLNRNHSDESIILAAQRIKKYKIKLNTEFIFGFPEETPADMFKSLELNDQLSAHSTSSFIFYPYPQTYLAKYCLEKGYLSDDNYKLIKQGYGSYHTTCLLNHDYINEVYKFKSILPVYNKIPKLLKPLFRKILTLEYGFLHKFIYSISIPLHDFDEFITRVKGIPKMIIKTRNALRK